MFLLNSTIALFSLVNVIFLLMNHVARTATGNETILAATCETPKTETAILIIAISIYSIYNLKILISQEFVLIN
jgi:hypothetical protein